MAESTSSKTQTVELENKITINGVDYEGAVEVPEELVEDLTRMDKDYNKYLAGLNKNNAVSGSLGSVSAS